jgi:hypothetical protein
MTPDGFRTLALVLPESEESAHMGHPDFRVRGKIFATLGAPDASFGMVKLTPEQQEGFVDKWPKVFVPVKGGWGLRGATNVRLAAATPAALRPALEVAWRNVAPPALVRSSGEATGKQPRARARKT